MRSATTAAREWVVATACALVLLAGCGGGGGGGTPAGPTVTTPPPPAGPARRRRADLRPFRPARRAARHRPGGLAGAAPELPLQPVLRGQPDGGRRGVLQVGVRSRGDGSRNEEKPGLKIEFDKYVPAQEYYGYKSLVIDNLAAGREHAARAAGLPRLRGDGNRRAPQRLRPAHRERRVLGALRPRGAGEQALPRGAPGREERHPLRLRVGLPLRLLLARVPSPRRTCRCRSSRETNERRRTWRTGSWPSSRRSTHARRRLRLRHGVLARRAASSPTSRSRTRSRRRTASPASRASTTSTCTSTERRTASCSFPGTRTPRSAAGPGRSTAVSTTTS